MIKILTVFPGNGAKFDNAVVDAIKLILLNYSNFSIAKIIVKEIERLKLTLSRLPTNTELNFNKLILIKSIEKSWSNKIIKI